MSIKTRAAIAFLLLSLLTAAIAPATAQTTQPVDLLAGANWKWQVERLATQPTTRPATRPSAEAFHLTAEAEFQVAYPPRYVSLDLTHGLNPLHKMKFTLNSHQIHPPLEGMLYRTIPGIDASWLVEGRNVLAAEVTGREAPPTAKSAPATTRPAKDSLARLEAEGPKMRLLALRSDDLAIVMGPILGAMGDNYFTVTCRTNMSARVTLTAEGRPAETSGEIRTGPAVTKRVTTTSRAGMIHRFTIEGASTRGLAYQLEARTLDGAGSITLGPWTLKGLPAEGKLRFVALGDNRSNPESWAKVVTAALKAKPDLVVHTGDLVSQGRQDWLWEDQFFAPAKELLAALPLYPVIGNHEGQAPLYYELFCTPSPQGRGRNWQQTIGAVQLIGIDGEADWSAGGENAKWLEEVLAASKAKFIFLVTHYPAWSSSRHGRVAGEGEEPAERPVRQGREVILPLLGKYRATALIAGHDHNYQRSEPPEGVSVIVTGGAGAPLYAESEDAARQNPYSKAFAEVLHYCLFTVEGDTCSMQALTPEGKTLDTRTWNARTVQAPRATMGEGVR